MNSLFINPSTLPGGKHWMAACAAAAAEAQKNSTATIEESLGCDASPISGLFQVVTLLLVYGYILYYVRCPTPFRRDSFFVFVFVSHVSDHACFVLCYVESDRRRI